VRSSVIDPWGGRQDLAKEVVKGVVSPEKRFQEDPLRLLRAVRFAAELAFRIDGRTSKAISSMARDISAVAPERIRDELIKTLVCEKPSRGLHLLVKTGLFLAVLPELEKTGKSKEKVLAQTPPDAVLRLAALFCAPARSAFSGGDPKCSLVARSTMGRLCFGKSMIRQVVNLVEGERALAGYDPAWRDGDLRRLVLRVGAENWERLVTLRKANLVGSAKGSTQALCRLKEVHSRIDSVIKAPMVRGLQDLAINGSDVMSMTGLSPGPKVGRILRRLSEALLDHPEWNKRERLSSMVEKMKPAALSDHHPKALVERHRTAGRLKARAQAEP
jgi:tRNA nucleotidyltransferase/poly(A) polymerase